MLASKSASAAETITLKTGFSLRADSHRAEGDQIIIEQASGFITIAASDIESIDAIAQQPVLPANHLPVRKVSNNPVGPEDAQRLLASASYQEGLPASFVLSVAHVESAFIADARSPKGAVGLMQLMPGTASYLGVSAAEPQENALGGARYLRELLVKYRGDARLALAAYNAGPAAVDRFSGVPPFRETQLYIERVLHEYAVRLKQEGAAPPLLATSSGALKAVRSSVKNDQ